MSFNSLKKIHLGLIHHQNYLEDMEIAQFFKNKTHASLIEILENPSTIEFQKIKFIFYDFNTFIDACSFCLKSNKNIDWLILFAGGTVFKKGEAIRLWMDMLPDAKSTNIAAYAHLMIPDDYSYFSIHTQMVAINTFIVRTQFKDIKELLKHDGKMDIAFKKYGDFHDGYTPYFILPDKECRKNVKINQKSAWLARLVNKGFSVCNFPKETIRNNKFFFYLDTQEKLRLAQSYKKGCFSKDKILNQAQKLDLKPVLSSFLEKDTLYEKYSELIFLHNVSKTYSEKLADTDFETVILPCAGFNYIDLYNQLKGTVKQFVHYDISSNAVNFRKYLIENLFKNSLEDIVDQFKQTKGHVFTNENPKNKKDYSKELLEKIKDLEHTYKNQNIIFTWKEILTNLKNKGYDKVFLDLSNIFDYYITLYKQHNSTQPFKDIVSFLIQNFKNWCIHIDHFGYYFKKDFLEFEHKDFYQLLYKMGATPKKQNSVSSNSRFYAHTVYKIKEEIPLSDINKVWKNSSVSFSKLFDVVHPVYEKKAYQILSEANIQHHDIPNWFNFYKHCYLPIIPLHISFNSDVLLAEAKNIYKQGLFTSNEKKESCFGKSFFTIYDKLNDSFTKAALESCPKTTLFFNKEFGKQIGCSNFTKIYCEALAPGDFIPPTLYLSHTTVQSSPVQSSPVQSRELIYCNFKQSY